MIRNLTLAVVLFISSNASSQVEISVGANIHYDDMYEIIQPKGIISELGKSLDTYLMPTATFSWTKKQTRLFWEVGHLSTKVDLYKGNSTAHGFTTGNLHSTSYTKRYTQSFGFLTNHFGFEHKFRKSKRLNFFAGPFLGFEIRTHEQGTNYYYSKSESYSSMYPNSGVTPTHSTTVSHSPFSLIKASKYNFVTGIRLGSTINIKQLFIRFNANIGLSIFSRFYDVNLNSPSYYPTRSSCELGLSCGYRFKNKTK